MKKKLFFNVGKKVPFFTASLIREGVIHVAGISIAVLGGGGLGRPAQPPSRLILQANKRVEANYLAMHGIGIH